MYEKLLQSKKKTTEGFFPHRNTTAQKQTEKEFSESKENGQSAVSIFNFRLQSNDATVF